MIFLEVIDNNTKELLLQVGGGGILLLAILFVIAKFLIPELKKGSTGTDKNNDDHTDVIIAKLDQLINHHNDFYGEFKELHGYVNDEFSKHHEYVSSLSKGWDTNMVSIERAFVEQNYQMQSLANTIKDISENIKDIATNNQKTNIILDKYLSK